MQLKETVDREDIAAYTLTVTISDSGIPALTSTVTLAVQITGNHIASMLQLKCISASLQISRIFTRRDNLPRKTFASLKLKLYLFV